jgi:hypothetical protein
VPTIGIFSIEEPQDRWDETVEYSKELRVEIPSIVSIFALGRVLALSFLKASIVNNRELGQEGGFPKSLDV